jgi:hypothetical protein
VKYSFKFLLYIQSPMCRDEKVFFTSPIFIYGSRYCSIALPLLRLVFLLFESEKNIVKKFALFFRRG